MTLAPSTTNIIIGVIEPSKPVVPKPPTKRTVRTRGFCLSGARCEQARSDANGRRRTSEDKKAKKARESKVDAIHADAVDPSRMLSYLRARFARTPGFDGAVENIPFTPEELEYWDEAAEQWFELLSPTIQAQLRSELGFVVKAQKPVNPAHFCRPESERDGYDDAMNHRVPGFDSLDNVDPETLGCGRRKTRKFVDDDKFEFCAS